jgi:Ca2+-binding EF-hand superfamily protein
MKSSSSRLIPLAIASILCGVALAGAGKDDHTQMMEKMMDRNGDGKITATEYLQGEKQLFSEIDANKDGFITAQELEAYHQSLMKNKGNAPLRNESGPGEQRMQDKKAYDPSGTGKSMPRQMTPEQEIAKMDTNNDGKVSAAEWEAAARQRFSKMDKDGDGTLTAQELRDGERAMMASDE